MNHLSFAEYLWLDGEKPFQRIRSKSRVMHLPKAPKVIDFRAWRFDGSSTGQANGYDSDCILKPVRVYPDPFRGDGNHIVLCEVHDSGGNIHESNQRALMRAAIRAVGDDLAPWLGCKQKYTLLNNGRPLGFPENVTPVPKGTFYCGVGCENVSGRDVAEAHAKACMIAGILLSGINAEGMPGQWEFQIGCRGIEGEVCDALTVADDVWLARYLLNRVGEQFGVHVSLDSKPIKSVCNHARMHTHFSTAFTRDPRCGLTAIQAIVNALESSPCDYIVQYGNYSVIQRRGKHEVCKIDALKSGRAYRSGSIHIPLHVVQRGYGYLEDLRPAANADPYQVGIGLINVVS